MDGGRSAGRSPQGPGPHGAPGRSWTQGQESDRGPGGPAGAQPPVPLCSLSAPSQLRDPTQAAPEQQEAQRPPGWEAPQALQPAQQAAEACSTGCESPQGIGTGPEGRAGWEVGGEAGRKPPHPISWQPGQGKNWGWVFGCLGICPEKFPGRWARESHLRDKRKGWASISWRLCPPPTPHSLPPWPIPRVSSLWTGQQVVEKALWNECVGVGREEDLGLES